MLTRFEKRKLEAQRVAWNLFTDYCGDVEAASDRVLAMCHGQRWLARMVERELFYLSRPQRRKAA